MRRQPPVPAAQVQAHIELLRGERMSPQRIADAAGVAERTVRNVRQQQRVQAATAAAILAVVPAPKPPPAGQVPGAGVSRRVQALAALGWSLKEQGQRMGMSMQDVWEIASERHRTFTTCTYDRVCRLFEALSGTPGTSARTLAAAARNGWLPPLAWDDLDAGRIAAEPGEDQGIVDEVAVERALAGERLDLTDSELLAAAQIGSARGMTPWALSDALHMNAFGVQRLLVGELPAGRAKRAARSVSVAS